MEIWKDVVGFEGIYFISNKGRVKSPSKKVFTGVRYNVRRERILKQTINRHGYSKVVLMNNRLRIDTVAHRVVAIAFVPNPDNKPYVNHKNGIKTDNRPENLEWATAKENTIHAIESGLAPSQKGETNNKAKLTKDQVLEIRKIFEKGKHGIRGALAIKYGVTKGIISRVARGQSWKHL